MMQDRETDLKERARREPTELKRQAGLARDLLAKGRAVPADIEMGALRFHLW